VLRLEFSRVMAVNADGAALLLDTLRQLQQQQREAILVGAAALTAQLRSLAIGRRDEGEAVAAVAGTAAAAKPREGIRADQHGLLRDLKSRRPRSRRRTRWPWRRRNTCRPRPTVSCCRRS
jgi:hypothetical protein